MSDGTEPRKCADCGVLPGELHTPGCDVERCALCGWQAIGCDCVHAVNASILEERDDEPTEEMWAKFDAEVAKYGGRLPWTGEWPGESECIEFGWYVYEDVASGKLVRCDKDHPGAMTDLNRLNARHAFWSRQKRRWVLSGKDV